MSPAGDKEVSMVEVTRHEPGSFSWAELATTDAAAAKKFYTTLFSWGFVDSPAGPDMVYTMLKMRDKSIGALFEMGAQQKGAPPHWTAYVTVASADESAKKAKQLGAKVLAEPFDVMDVGRMATIQDREGATLCLWQAKKHIGTEIVNEPNTMCWGELETTDTESAKTFYTGLFGWGAKAGGDYTEFQLGGKSIGGMMKIPKEWGPVPPYWLIYFAVTDCDATEKKVRELGGKAIVPSTDIENVGRFAVLSDPQGAVFAVVKLTQS
jgi:predicted enzyme related to lactoylglutathione lyase